MKHPGMFVLAALASVGLVRAADDPIAGEVRSDFKAVEGYMIRSAEKMPAEDYAFKPTPDVRSFAQQIAHVADDQYNLCAPARNETRQAAYTEIENTLSTKPELVAALRKAFAYCDVAYDGLTDASGNQPAKGAYAGRTKFGMLNWNLWHTWEHYGNVVVYLRMKGLVPPSSERR
jgi:uncharacterized damage-inducible protein DinB